MRVLFIWLVSVLLGGCGGPDIEATFNRQVTSTESGEVHSLRGGKVSCLHCPMYFAFGTNNKLTERIISQHHLRPTIEANSEIQQIENLVKSEAGWWEMVNPERQEKVYWVKYKAKQPELETAFRLLVVRGKMSFFITSGYFDSADYASEG
jgi:hypothetical protein